MLGGRYRVLDRVGSGGMAEVFRARDEVLDRVVAVKVFRAEHVAADSAHGLERQQIEVSALARLNHPNLIALYDGAIGPSADGRGHAYLVMELIDGPSLAARIAQGPLPEPAVREIGIQLADGLAYVHSNGMVHRDVKPENILLGTDRSDDDSTVRARLSDFGIVRLLGSERLTSANFTLGTASYLAPEQARGSDVDPPADVYSLGLVLIEAFTGRRSFDGPPLEAAIARLTQRPQIPAGLPEPWPGLLYAMTDFDPAMRPSAAQVARTLRGEGSRSLPVAAVAVPLAAGFGSTEASQTEAIAAVGSGAAPAAFVPSAYVDDPDTHHKRPTGWLVAAGVSALIILATLGLLFLTGGSDGTPVGSTSSSSVQSPAAKTTTTPHKHRRSAAAHSSAPSVARTSARPSRTKTSSSAPSSSAAASSSAASHTSSAPSTSSAPATSASRSSAPATPSAARTTAASRTSASSRPATSPAAKGTTSPAVTGTATTAATAAAAAAPSG